MKIVGYIRVSRVGGREGESFQSPKIQRDAIEEYAAKNGHEVVAIFEDYDVSGGREARPEFDKALLLLDSGQADALVARTLNRLARRVSNLGKLLARAKENGWHVIALDFGMDPNTPNGKLVANVLGAVAEWELDNASETWRTALANANARGIHVASKTPTGYRRREDKRLEPDPVAAPVIRGLFLMRGAGASWGECADFLNSSEAVGPYSAANWTRAAAQKIVQNRVYVGEARSNKLVHKDAHDAIVTEAEWRAANRKNGSKAPARTEDALLSGLIRCCGCRYLMKSDKHGRKGAKVRSYRCRGDHAAGKCPAPAFTQAHLIDPYVEELFLYELREGGKLVAEGVSPDRDLEEATAALETAEAELAAYLEITSALDGDAFRHGLEIRQQAVDEAVCRVQELQDSAVGEVTLDLRQEWPNLTVPEKRRLMASVIDAVMLKPMSMVDKDLQVENPLDARVEILWRGEQDSSDFPRRGHRPPLASYDF